MKFLKNGTIPKKLKKIKEILFSYDYEDNDDDENIYCPYIHLENYEEDIEKQEDKNDIALTCQEAFVVARYPLSREFIFKVSTRSKKGFTKKALIKEIGKIYSYIYETEDNSSNVEVVPFDERETLLNRNSTDGIFGIWGHDLGDLDLGGIDVYTDKDGNYYLRLGIDS